MGKRVVILQSNYIPWKGYFELIHRADVFCFYDEVQYTKNDWRNRNKILGPNGLFWITVPVEKEAVKGKISEAKVTNYDWQEKHFRTIEQTYSKALNRNAILELLEPIYLSERWDNISKLNQLLIEKLAKHIGINTIIKNSADYQLKDERLAKLVDLIKQLDGSEYLSGPNAKNYLSENESIFSDNDIQLTYMNYGPYLEYENKRKTFDHQTSILDVLMNVPKEEYLNYITSQT
ncbi:MAG: WbqC family protein [Flavobacteriales bacterium]|nr:WbqC family protein [Flavobacteriales bacterium]